jgi:hypothetical protein
MPARPAVGNARKSAARAFIEHALAGQKARMEPFVRSVRLAVANTKTCFAKLAYNRRRLLWLKLQTGPAR